MAKTIKNNFRKFIKLASAVKKVADNDPNILDFIISDTENKSGSNWNIIQRWTSKKVFVEFKHKPFSNLTEKNIKDVINRKTKRKHEGCFSVFKILDRDILSSEWFDLEEKLLSFPPNLQVEVSLQGLPSTGITKIKNLPLGKGELTADIRDIGDSSSLDSIRFERLRIKGKADNFKNCHYYIKAIFESDSFTADEIERFAVRDWGTDVLTQDEQDERERRKQEAKEIRKRKEKVLSKKKRLKKVKLPEKVADEEVATEVTETAEESMSSKTKRAIALDNSIKNLMSLNERGILSDEALSKAINKIIDTMEKGGVINES